jgi:protein-S-isoprenylcysteine O-methyltransferase Ste14
LNTLLTLLVVAGAVVFRFFYHIRTRRLDPAQRAPIPSWGAYVWVDFYLKVSTLLITLAAIRLDHPWLLELHDSVPLSLVGLGLAGFALLLFMFAMWTLDHQFTPAHASRVPTAIVQSGPYRFIRHPIYTSNLILMVGMLLLSGSAWIAINLLILIAYYLPTIIVEERAIKECLPQYQDYASRTGMIFPRWRRGDDQ